MSSPLRVVLAGGTGLVGRECLRLLCAEPRVTRIVALQRGAGESDARLQRIATDFERLDELPDTVFDAELALCALGTTIRVAGSQAAFRRVDHDYIVAFAQRARRGGARCFGLVSALGADPGSRVFYNRVKGETEQALAGLGFASLVVARPSLLLGERREVRLGERLAAPLGRWLPARWRAIPATTVARALVAAVIDPLPGTTRLENAALLDA